MKITFKDVGQGDSILIEWNENGIPKIGIIDCNRKSGTNPVLEHIEKSHYKIIDFLILSHPHSDHFSGMVELLDYFEKNDIIILTFGHTIHLLANDYYKYLNGVAVGTEVLSDLEKLFNKVDVLRKKEIIRFIDFLVEGSEVDIMDGITMKCLSPSKVEAETFMKLVDLQPITNKTKTSSSANLLSTIFKIVIGDEYYLLTADSEVLTFERLMKQNRHRDLTGKNLVMCQLPHHGASNNYYPQFWEYLSKSETPHAVVSAGPHETYKHPHLPVLMGFYNQGYTIHSTNIVYGMINFADYLKQLSDLTSKLNTFTNLAYSNTGGDKSFPMI